jgi:pimeloyl-ACP methyl ester carboxylesterase
MAAAAVILLQRTFIYHPSSEWISLPEEYQAKAVTYITQDHISLTSWYCAPQDHKPVFVMFHGNGGNISYRGLKQAYFCKQGYGFLLAEYRGYGRSAGSPTEKGLYNDARAAISWLIHDQRIDESRLIIYGESIGTGVASQMAIEYPHAKALVLEAPLTSIPDMVGSVMPWMWPFRHMVLDTYDNLAKAPHWKMPTIVLQGDHDEVVPVEKGKMVFAAIIAKGKKLVIMSGGRHNDLVDFGLLPKIQEFVDGL